MKRILVFVIIIAVVFLSISCKKNKDISKEKIPKKSQQERQGFSDKEDYARQSVDDYLAKNIKNFLVNDYLKSDISFMDKSDRKFQFYKIDLNGDGEDEIFVRFFTPYFCGTGGCTFLLLDKNLKIITDFTVTRAPIFVETTIVNGWSILLVKDHGVFKELKYENGTYPSNPSMLPKAPYDAPSGHAVIMFDEYFSKAKTYEF